MVSCFQSPTDKWLWWGPSVLLGFPVAHTCHAHPTLAIAE